MLISALTPDRLFITDAGLETDMVFNRGIDLPYFSSLALLQTADGRRELEAYYRGFLDLAVRLRTGCILESATWRASADWTEPLGLDSERLAALNRDAVAMLLELRSEYLSLDTPILISGCVGPRGDGYSPGSSMSADEAAAYHYRQAQVLIEAGVDMVSAITMTNVPEAVGIVRAAEALGAPVVISFTVETDGRLPTGDALGDAIEAVDAATGSHPAYYMINCAHPTHFTPIMREEERWVSRVQGLRANASSCSHAELDVMTELDAGDPAELAASYQALRRRFPNICVLGGCCGTDLRHVTAIAEACVSA